MTSDGRRGLRNRRIPRAGKSVQLEKKDTESGQFHHACRRNRQYFEYLVSSPDIAYSSAAPSEVPLWPRCSVRFILDRVSALPPVESHPAPWLSKTSGASRRRACPIRAGAPRSMNNESLRRRNVAGGFSTSFDLLDQGTISNSTGSQAFAPFTMDVPAWKPIVPAACFIESSSPEGWLR